MNYEKIQSENFLLRFSKPKMISKAFSYKRTLKMQESTNYLYIFYIRYLIFQIHVLLKKYFHCPHFKVYFPVKFCVKILIYSYWF